MATALFAAGADVTMQSVRTSYCYLTQLRGNWWNGTGLDVTIQGPQVLIEHDGNWHLKTYQETRKS